MCSIKWTFYTYSACGLEHARSVKINSCVDSDVGAPGWWSCGSTQRTQTSACSSSWRSQSCQRWRIGPTQFLVEVFIWDGCSLFCKLLNLEHVRLMSLHYCFDLNAVFNPCWFCEQFTDRKFTFPGHQKTFATQFAWVSIYVAASKGSKWIYFLGSIVLCNYCKIPTIINYLQNFNFYFLRSWNRHK